MSVEHSGGPPDIGFEDHNELQRAEIVPIVEPELPEETLEDLYLDHISTGGSLRSFVEGIKRADVQESYRQGVLDGINKVLDLGFLSPKPGFAQELIAVRINRPGYENQTVAGVATRFGIEKEAAQQFCKINIDPLIPDVRSQTQRNDEAKDEMRKNNYRHIKAPRNYQPGEVLRDSGRRRVRGKSHFRRVGKRRQKSKPCV